MLLAHRANPPLPLGLHRREGLNRLQRLSPLLLELGLHREELGHGALQLAAQVDALALVVGRFDPQALDLREVALLEPGDRLAVLLLHPLHRLLLRLLAPRQALVELLAQRLLDPPLRLLGLRRLVFERLDARLGDGELAPHLLELRLQAIGFRGVEPVQIVHRRAVLALQRRLALLVGLAQSVELLLVALVLLREHALHPLLPVALHARHRVGDAPVDLLLLAAEGLGVDPLELLELGGVMAAQLVDRVRIAFQLRRQLLGAATRLPQLLFARGGGLLGAFLLQPQEGDRALELADLLL